MAKIDLTEWKEKNVIKGGYYKYLNGQYHKYQGLETCFDEIKKLVEDTFNYAKKVVEENDALKNEHWKDEKLQELQKQIDYYKENRRYGFQMTKEQHDACYEWEKKHEAEQHNAKTLEMRLRRHGAIGGGYYYKFVPTSIGVTGTYCCSQCINKARRNCGDNYDRYKELVKEYDAEYEFQDLD